MKALEVPQEVTWSDEDVARQSTETVQMHIKVAGSMIETDLTFFVLPWDTDLLAVGWESMIKSGVQRQLEDLIAAQEAQGLGTGVGTTDGNQMLTDMDGDKISTDELLFADEPAAEVPSTSVLNPAEQIEMDLLLEGNKEVFEPRPAGGARVVVLWVFYPNTRGISPQFCKHGKVGIVFTADE